MIIETDWEVSAPPRGIPIDAFIRGQVRRGSIINGYFMATDCTYPLQNCSLDVDGITGWRYRVPEPESTFDISILSAGAMIQMLCCMGA